MGQRYNKLSNKYIEFIKRQKIFFVATAASDGRINLSPKGMDTFKVIDNNRIAWLNVTGSGNETAAHVSVNTRMTIMFAAFEGDPTILRLYGNAKVIHQYDAEWEEMKSFFILLPGARQIFDVNIDLVQKSCGMSIPYFNYVGERDLLNKWAIKRGDNGIKKYWKEKNQSSLDGIETNILESDK